MTRDRIYAGPFLPIEGMAKLMRYVYFKSDGHALRTGMLMGTLVKAGIRCEPVTDDEGNYTPDIIIHLDDETHIRITTQE